MFGEKPFREKETSKAEREVSFCLFPFSEVPGEEKNGLKIFVDKSQKVWYNTFCYRGVAQFGRALRSGRRGRGFKSRHLDHVGAVVAAPIFYSIKNQSLAPLLLLFPKKSGLFGDPTDFNVLCRLKSVFSLSELTSIRSTSRCTPSSSGAALMAFSQL